MIDFGITHKYKEPDGTHIPFKVDVPFTGNIVFSSVNSFLNYGKFNGQINHSIIELS